MPLHFKGSSTSCVRSFCVVVVASVILGRVVTPGGLKKYRTPSLLTPAGQSTDCKSKLHSTGTAYTKVQQSLAFPWKKSKNFPDRWHCDTPPHPIPIDTSGVLVRYPPKKNKLNPGCEPGHSDNYSAPVGERSIATSLSVCLCVSLSASISLEPLDRSSRNLLCRSPVAVARSSSGGVAMPGAESDVYKCLSLSVSVFIFKSRCLVVCRSPRHISFDCC